MVIKKIISLLVLALTSSSLFADWQMNMPVGVTPISRDIYGLHMLAIWICVAIGVVVFSVMIYAIIMHRKSRGVKAAEFHEHPVLEVIWTIIPFIILIALAIPATRILLDMDDTSKADVTIKVVGHQWKWSYEYLDQNIKFFSNMSTPLDQIQNKAKKGEYYLLEVDNPIVVPINKKIRFLVTSQDVIHSWWVPELAIKRDAIPGFIHESWARIEEPGTYRGQCAELCGVNHGFMPIVVEAVSEEAFANWVAAQNPNALEASELAAAKTREVARVLPVATSQSAATDVFKTYTREDLMKMGEATHDKMCAVCHRVDGEGMPPVFPAIKASSIAIGKPISRHIDMILFGVPGSAMQAFQDQLSVEEIAAVITYQRNAFENNTGDLVQPADVVKVRDEYSGREK